MGADTGVGKSSIARAICYSAARAGKVLVFNLEDGNRNYANRILGEQTGEGANNIRKLNFSNDFGNRLESASSLEIFKNWYIDEDTYDPRTQCQLALSLNDVGLVVVDYVQLIRAKGKDLTQQQGIIEALGYYQWLSKKINCAVLVLSQIATKQVSRRGWEYYIEARRRGEKGDNLYNGYIPLRGDFAWASELDWLGKMQISAFRPGPYRKEHGDSNEDRAITLNMLKVNDGPSECKFTLGWDPKLTRVYDISTRTND